jgi:hypothetical protein
MVRFSRQSRHDRHAELNLQIGADTMELAAIVCDLSGLLDSGLSMKQHVCWLAAACFEQLRRLHQISCRVGQDFTIYLVLAPVTSRLDYCNSFLANLPQSKIEPLQRVQNADF